MKKLFIIFISLFFISTIFSNLNSPLLDPKINVNNVVLTKVNGKNISVIDVMKKMDFIFHKSYPNLENSKPARYQFYLSSWKNVLKEMINTELMVAQAELKEVKIHDGEIREEMEDRFGPNTMITLEKIGLSYDEAFEMIKTEMIVKRMMWYFVQSKVLTQVTPQLIRQEYKIYTEKNPPFDEWQYQVISIKNDDESCAKLVAEKTYQLLKDSSQSPEELSDKIKEIEKEYPSTSIQISSTYNVTSKDISDSHKNILLSLKEDSYSQPICQASRFDNKKNNKIFYLKKYNHKIPPSFEEMADNIKNELLQKHLSDESENYFGKLRKYYNIVDEETLLPENFTPFSLE